MAQALGGNKVKLDNGSVVDAQQGGWYDGQQYWGGTLSQRGVINSLSNQQGAGQAVSQEVNRQSAAAQNVPFEQFQAYLNQPTAPQYNQVQTGILSDGSGGVGGGIGGGFTNPNVPNLPQLYDTLVNSSGIKDLESQLSQKEKDYIDATGMINDNPFLSEATRVGRVAKLDDLFQKRTANLRDQIATQKADIETRLNLETKQFDINSQASQQALAQFSTLLSMGALDGASGEDIANITRSTGLSSQAIQSAITAQRNKNRQTSVQTFTADSGEVTAVVLDTQTGQVVSSTSLGMIGNAQGGSGGGSSKVDYKNMLKEDASAGASLSQIYSLYSGYIDPNEIYSLYNSSSKYGADKNKNATKGTGYLNQYGVTLFK